MLHNKGDSGLKDIIIFGANDLGRLLKYYLEDDNDKRNVVAFTMNASYITSDTFLGLPVVPFETVENVYSPNEFEILIAIGNSKMNDVRKRVFLECKQKGYTLASYYHSSYHYPTKAQYD